MFEHLTGNKKSPDEFIEKRTFFIRQLIEQKKIKNSIQVGAPK